MDEHDTHACAVDIAWDTFRKAYEVRRRRPILSDLSEAGRQEHRGGPPVAAADSDGDRGPWVARLRGVDASEHPALLTTLLRDEVADTLGFDDGVSVAPSANFYDIGMDSLMMADLVSRLSKRLGFSCTGMVFDHPTVESLAPALLDRIALGSPAPGVSVAAAADIPPIGTVGYATELEDEIFQFQRLAWPHRSAELIPARWRWMFVESARRLGREPIVWLHRDNGATVGHMGAIQVRLRIGSEERHTAWCVDTMVLESHRSRAIGSRLMVDARESLPFALSLGQTSEMRQICLRLGWKQVAPLQIAQFLVNPEKVLKGKLPAPAAWAATLGLRATSTVRELMGGRGPFGIRPVGRFGDVHDRLWARVSADLTCAVVRDASYLNWKYVDQPGQDFVRLEVTQQDEAVAVAVWMFREADDQYRYRRAFLVDLVAPLADAAALRQIIRAACTAVAEDADALLCHHTDARLTAALRACGFRLRQPERFLLVDPGPLGAPALSSVLSSDAWFVTHGDSDIDRPW